MIIRRTFDEHSTSVRRPFTPGVDRSGEDGMGVEWIIPARGNIELYISRIRARK